MLSIPRLLCVLIPNLPVQVERSRHESALPLVISNPIGADTVYAASADVVQAGVRVGMPLYEARQIAPAAKIVHPNEEEYHKEHEAIKKAVKAYAPKLETHSLGELIFDMRGLAPMYGGESKLATALIDGIRSVTRLAVQIGVGAGKFIAQTAARKAPLNAARIVSSGTEASFVAPIAIVKMPGVPREVTRRLLQLDIQTLGELAALSKPAVLRQFGGDVSAFYELARGHDPRPLLVDIPPLRVTEPHTLKEPVANRQIISNIVAHLCNRVSQRLQARGYHTEALKVSIDIEHRAGPVHLEWGQALKPPTADHIRLTCVAELLLDRLVIKGPVSRVVLVAYPLRSWTHSIRQYALEEAGTAEKWALFEEAQQLLIHRFGESVIQSASVIQPPPPIRVPVRTANNGRPTAIVIGEQIHSIRGVDEKWRVERGWWDVPVFREYYRIVLDDGSLRNVFIDLNDGQWYLDRSWPIL